MTEKNINIDNFKGQEFEPALTLNQVEEQESIYQSREKDIGIARRIAYTITSKSKTELSEMIDKDPDLFMDMLENISDAVKFYQNVIDVMSSAEVRSLVVASEAIDRLNK